MASPIREVPDDTNEAMEVDIPATDASQTLNAVSVSAEDTAQTAMDLDEADTQCTLQDSNATVGVPTIRAYATATMDPSSDSQVGPMVSVMPSAADETTKTVVGNKSQTNASAGDRVQGENISFPSLSDASAALDVDGQPQVQCREPKRHRRANKSIPATAEIIDLDELPDPVFEVIDLEAEAYDVKPEPQEEPMAVPTNSNTSGPVHLETPPETLPTSPIVIDQTNVVDPPNAESSVGIDLGTSTLSTRTKVRVPNKYKQTLKATQQYWAKQLMEAAGSSEVAGKTAEDAEDVEEAQPSSAEEPEFETSDDEVQAAHEE
jgi:hypothetical protein